MTHLNFLRDGWLDGGHEDEAASLARLKITVGDAVVTRAFSKRGGGETQSLNIPMLPLANYIARQWWSLLYEPSRLHNDPEFAARHRLDLPMHGYVFPALALCSAGGRAVLVDWAPLENEHSPLRFLTEPPPEPVQVARDGVEPVLMDVVESTLERLSVQSRGRERLAEDWRRIRESLAKPEQAAYCMAAGRLGVDPYDPEAPNIVELANGLSEELFSDVSDAVGISRVREATTWTRDVESRLASRAKIDVAAFGEPPQDDLGKSPGEIGNRAAVELRLRLGLNALAPASARELFGRGNIELSDDGPLPITGLVYRENEVAYIGAVARTARQRFFRAFAATYIAWSSNPGDRRAGTTAYTRRQQSSRAFAAEMVAPQQYLLARARDGAFTEEDIEEEAGRLIAPYDTVMWQAQRAGVELWGVERPTQRRNIFF